MRDASDHELLLGFCWTKLINKIDLSISNNNEEMIDKKKKTTPKELQKSGFLVAAKNNKADPWLLFSEKDRDLMNEHYNPSDDATSFHNV